MLESMASRCRCSELVAVLIIFAGYAGTLSLTAQSTADVTVLYYGNGSMLAFPYQGSAGEVAVQVIGVPLLGDTEDVGVKEVKLVGSDAFLLTGDGVLRRERRFAGQLSLTSQDVEIVARDVLAFAVDSVHGFVYYISRDHVASVLDNQRKWRLCVASCNLTLQRTLIGGGAAPAASAMAVDFTNGYLFLLSRKSTGVGVLTRTRLDGTAREEMAFGVPSPDVALSSLVVSQAAGKPSVFWLESTSTYSRISRSLYVMRARKISRIYRPDPVQHLWSSGRGVHFLEDLQDTDGPAVVRSVLNKRLNNDPGFEVSTATLPESTAQATCDSAGNQICVPLVSLDGAGMSGRRCMLATVYADGRQLSFAGTDRVLLATTGSQLVTIFVDEVDANNLTIAEPLYRRAWDSHVHGLAVDLFSADGPRVFWSQRRCGASTLLYSELDGTAHGVFESNGVRYPEAIAFDPVSKVVLWNDARHQITAKSSDGRVRITTLASSDRAVQGLAVDSSAGLMYWIEGGVRGRIMQAYLDGTGATAVADTSMASIISIDTTVTPSRLYWVELTNNTASVLKHAQGGTYPQQFTPPLPVVPTTIAVDDTYIYLAHSMGVYKIAKGSGRSWSSLILIRSIPGVTSLAVVDFRRRAKGAPANDFCGTKNGYCSELCLPSADARQRCHCDPGRQVTSVVNLRASTCRGPSPQVMLAGRKRLLALAINRQGQLSESSLQLPPCPHKHAHDCFLLAVDPVKHHIYIAPRGGQVIYRHSYFSLDTQPSTLSIVLHTGSHEMSSIHGLAFDEQSSNLFWTDSKSHRVEVVHVDRRSGDLAHRTVLIWSGLRHPRHIVVDPVEGLLYISLRGSSVTTSSIVKASMRGEILETVYRSPSRTSRIHSMALYKTVKSLFVSIGDAVLNVDLTPGYRSSTVHSCALDPNTTCGHLAMSRNHLYLTTNGPKSMLFTAKIKAESGSLHPVSLGKLERMSNVTLSSPLTVAGDSAGTDESFGQCSDSWMCGGLCLPKMVTQLSALAATACTGAHSSCYCPHGHLTAIAGGQQCREPSEDEEHLLVVSKDGTLRLVAVDTSTDCATADDCDGTLASVPPLPLRLSGNEPLSVTFDRRTNRLLWMDVSSRSIASVHFSGRNYSLFYKIGDGSAGDMPSQIALNEVSGYLYLVGGKERVQVVHRNGTYFGRIVLKRSVPRLLATDEATGLIFWIEDAKHADAIIWGAGFGQPKYSTFLYLRGAHTYTVTAMAADNHRLVYAEKTSGTVRMCAFSDYDFTTTDSYAQRKCQIENIVVLQRGTGNVSSLVISSDMLYYTNDTGVWSVGLPLANSSHVHRQQQARLVMSGTNIQSALLYRAKRNTKIHRKAGGCELNNTCQYFCQSIGHNYICSCPLGMNLLADGRSCKGTGCSNTQHYCQHGAQIAGGLQRTDRETCVPFTYECDHDCDCADDCSDEGEFCECEDPDERKCPAPDYFKCYKPHQRCDGVPDCINAAGGDEKNCTIECPKKGERMCHKNGTNDPICVMQHNFCDGIKDCSDGTDEDEMICGEDSSKDADLRYASSSGASNIVTGVLLGLLLLALAVAFAVFYCYQKGRDQSSKRSSQASMIDGGVGGSGRSDRYQDSSSSPSGSVTLSEGSDNPSNDSTMSPLSRDTIGQTSKTTETTMLTVALANNGSESAHAAAVGGGRIERRAPSPDSSQKDSGHIEGDSPCAESQDDDSDSDGSDQEDDIYPDSINGSDGDEAPVSVPVPSALDDLFSITTDEVNKVPTQTTKTLLQVPGIDGRRPVISNLIANHPPSHSSNNSGNATGGSQRYNTKAPYGQSSARRPKPTPYGYHPRLEEYPPSDEHMQVYNDYASEDFSVAEGGENGGGPCPSECSQPISYAGNLLVPCPSVCSAAYQSEVSASEFSFPSDMTSESQYSVNEYPHLPKSRVMTLPKYPSDLSDGRSDSLPADNYSLVTGASSLGPPAAPCGSPVTVATIDVE